VQVLPLEVGEFGGKKPAIAFNISPMAPHSVRMKNRSHLLGMFPSLVLSGGGEVAIYPSHQEIR